MQYDFRAIEQKWQNYWASEGTFRAPNPGDPHFDHEKPKYYVLDMFPYPSGVGLHVGHPLGYIATDIIARYKRMQGFNVLHPMGYDAFGLPAEQFAVEHGVHPRITTEKNIANMTRQLKLLGLSYDWDRCISTTDPDYYRWTQWIFLQLYNSWFDPSTKKARPISDLVKALEGSDYYIDFENQLVPAGNREDLEALAGPPDGFRKWYELSPDDQRTIIDGQRLAFLDEVPVNWCPALGTVLANEEVTNDGRSERGNHPVYQRPLKQWMLRITAYADRLESELDLVDWPEPIKLMQRNWIGRSTGAEVDFEIAPSEQPATDASTASDADLAIITVFTTRPDTLFGATYMVLAPEHPLVEEITTPAQKAAVDAYRTQAAKKTDRERQVEATTGTKSGVFTGAYAINPVNDSRIPIWIADYVMMGYGTGAIMAVPAHDERDFAFAKAFNLPIKQVIALPTNGTSTAHPTGELTEAFTADGITINSANASISLNGLTTDLAKARITQWLDAQGVGHAKVQYKLRDWLFSRQRYWGEPFPILHGPKGEIVPVDERDLPVELPEMEDFRPAASDDPDAPPRPPLGRAPESWRYVVRDGVRYERELNTMPQWAGSCWYYLRFLDPKNSSRMVGEVAEKYWMLPRKIDPQPREGVDLYVGGAEHAVLHLLYSRFWHKVLFDLGHVSTPEPFGRLFNQGYIQAFYYEDARGTRREASQIEERDGKFFHQGEEVNRLMGKMGKSLKNAIAPDEIAAQYGCDTLRLYEMYLGPLDQSKVWRTQDIIGVHRFLQRLWRNFIDESTSSLRVSKGPAPPEILRLLHKTIKRVTDAMNNLAFNVAIAALIELNNELVGKPSVTRDVAEPMILLLAPLAPHIAEELWRRLGYEKSLAYQPWPAYAASMLESDEIEYPVQISGKVRGRIMVSKEATDDMIQSVTLANPAIKPYLDGKTIKKFIVVKGRMVNVVVS